MASRESPRTTKAYQQPARQRPRQPTSPRPRTRSSNQSPSSGQSASFRSLSGRRYPAAARSARPRLVLVPRALSSSFNNPITALSCREPPSAVVGLNPSGISRRVPAFGFGCRLCFGHEPCRCKPNFLDRIVGIAGPPHTLAMAATAASECDPPFVSVRYFYFGGIDQRLEDPRIGDQHDIANWNQIGSAPEVPPPPGPVAHFVRWRAPRRESPKICNAPSAQNPAQPSLALVNMQTVSSRSGTTLVNEM